MTEKDKFKMHVLSRISLSDEEMEALLNAFVVKKIKKKQFIIQPDFTAKYRTYVVEGSFRSYVIGEDGIDHTIQLPWRTGGFQTSTAIFIRNLQRCLW